MEKSHFEKLEVYQMAVKIAEVVWNMVGGWKRFERDTLGEQLVNAADSIGANIAEGCGRGSFQDNKRFVRSARGSLNETRHWLKLAYQRKLLQQKHIVQIKPLIDELAPRLNAYLKSIGNKHPTTDHGPRTTDK